MAASLSSMVKSSARNATNPSSSVSGAEIGHILLEGGTGQCSIGAGRFSMQSRLS